MKGYEKYVEVESRWAKYIPESWTFSNIAEVFIERKENNNPIKTMDILSLINTRGVIPYKEKGNIGNKAKEDLTGYRLAYPGDIVFNSMNAVIGSVGLSKYFGAVSPVYYMLYLRDTVKNSVRYFDYVFQDKVFQNGLNGLGNGILEIRMRIPMSKLKYVGVPVPPRAEQDQIVRYLDWQVSKINRLIAAKRKEIDAIHDMEHLYIDHVFSEIANQKTIRLKYLVEQFVDCPHETPEYCKDGDYCVIRTADQDYGYLRSETLMYRLTESEYTNRIRRAPLNAGDIVYGREGERWGLACVIPESEKFCLGQRIMQFVCNKQMVTPEYVMWALNSSYVRNQGILDTMGSTSPHVNISTIINFRIPYTSREHQHTLVSKIECTMQKYRQLCERIENEIQLLHDLRTRLISDVVTGQIDVRGIEVPKHESVDDVVAESEVEELEVE